VNLGTGVLSSTATYYVATGAINTVSVRDLRDSDVGWNVNAQIGNFTTAGDSFSGDCLGFAPPPRMGGPVGFPLVSRRHHDHKQLRRASPRRPR
jgi:hypothetical protein